MPELVEMRTFNLTSLASIWRQPKLRHSNLMARLHHCRRMPRDPKAVGSFGSRDPSGGGKMQHRPRVMHIILLSILSTFTVFHHGPSDVRFSMYEVAVSRMIGGEGGGDRGCKC